MASIARYLADKSALARMQLDSVSSRLGPLIESGQIATCAIIDLEVLYSAKNYEEHSKIRTRRSIAYRVLPLSQSIFERAIEVQSQLARSGKHRIPIADLIIAATAEDASLIVIHYDSDFDTIASVTGQVCEWVVPRGSVA